MMYPKQKFHMSIIKTTQEINNTCSICYEDTNLQNQLITSCNHIFCISCTKEYMINTTKKHNLECPYCRQIIVHIKMSKQEEINLMRKKFCKLTQTIHFMEPPIQENYPYPLPNDINDIYLLNNYLQEFMLDEDNIIHYNILFGWICVVILICIIIYRTINIWNNIFFLYGV